MTFFEQFFRKKETLSPPPMPPMPRMISEELLFLEKKTAVVKDLKEEYETLKMRVAETMHAGYSADETYQIMRQKGWPEHAISVAIEDVKTQSI